MIKKLLYKRNELKEFDILWLSIISEHVKMNYTVGYYAVTPL